MEDAFSIVNRAKHGKYIRRGTLLPLRVILGVWLCYAGITKYQAGWLDDPSHLNNLLAEKNQSPLKFTAKTRNFIDRKILDDRQLWSNLIVAGQVVIGAALVVGFCVRLMCFFGTLATAGAFLMFIRGPLGFEADTAHLMILLGYLTLLFGGAGRVFGIDALFARKFRRCPLW